MQGKINSILDQNEKPRERPATAKPVRNKELDFKKPKLSDDFSIKSPLFSSKPESEAKEEEDAYEVNCKICKHRPLLMPLNEYKNLELSPVSLNGNQYQQSLLLAY